MDIVGVIRDTFLVNVESSLFNVSFTVALK
ncbi:hypothetical protein ES703_15138 [subsurface metagenome]